MNAKKLRASRKALRKMVGILTKEDGDVVLRAWADRLSFITLDEQAVLKGRKAMLAEVRDQLRELHAEEQVMQAELLGPQALSRVYHETKAGLQKRGLDPEQKL